MSQPWGLQCKRAGTGWALVHGPQWTQDPFPHAPDLETMGGAYGPGQSSWPEPRRSHGSQDHKRHNRGVWEVEGQSPRLGRHIDVPERDGATGGLIPEQQGWRVWVRVCLRTAQLCAGLCSGFNTGA